MKQLTLFFFLFFQNVYSQSSLTDFILEYDHFIINQKEYRKSDSVFVRKVLDFIELNPNQSNKISFRNVDDKIVVTINYTLPEKIYHLIKIDENAVIDQKAINILSTMQIESYQDFTNNKFKTIHGNKLVYHYVATYKGLSFTDEVNDLMVLEVNPKNKQIVRGYHITKEWTAFPLSNDLYEISSKNRVLVDSLPLSLLEFKHVETKELLADDGFIEHAQ